MKNTLTESSVLLIQISIILLGAAKASEQEVEVTEHDEGRREDRTVMEDHNQLISLELPDLVGDGLHLHKSVAVGEEV